MFNTNEASTFSVLVTLGYFIFGKEDKFQAHA